MRNSLTLLASGVLAISFAGCKGTKTSSGGGATPEWKPSEGSNIAGESATPPHSLPRHEYPFDAEGKYMAAWAREGEVRMGRSVSSGSSSSHRQSSSSSRSSGSGSRYHKVVAGDTLWGLGRRYGKSVATIKKANGLKSDKIVNGRTLKIPR